MKLIAHIVLLIFALCTAAHAQIGPHAEDSLNMSLWAHQNPVDKKGAHSSLWGYTSPGGREYALFGSQIGTHIIDVTERPIREVAFIWGPTNSWREMKVYKTWAYIVCESPDSGTGLQIVDLSELPEGAALVRTDTTHFKRAHTLFVRDHYLYVNGTQPGAGANQGTIIFDLEPDPMHPVRLGQIDPFYIHDAWVRNDTLIGAGVHNAQGAVIYDVRDKMKPVRLAEIRYPYSGTHNAEMTEDGRYVVTSDEVGFTQKTMKVWDISDLENIVKVAELTPNPDDIVHNVHIIGRYAYVSWYSAGVRIIDMIDPRHPREVGFYDTYPWKNGGFSGVWEVYAQFASGKIIASDRQTGLYVLTFNGATAGSVSGVVRSGDDGTPLAGVRVDVRAAKKDTFYLTDAAGRYYVGGVEGDRIGLRFSRFDMIDESRDVTLTGDITLDVTLTPREWVDLKIVGLDDRGGSLGGFLYAVEPYVHSTATTSDTAVVRLPVGNVYTVTVGRWGRNVVEEAVSMTGPTTHVVGLDRRYRDNATLDLGWSYADSSDAAITGRWTRSATYPGLPGTGISYAHPAVQPGDRPGHVFITGTPSFNAPPETGDVNKGATTLTSPSMDLRDHPDPEISFDYWLVSEMLKLSDTSRRESLHVEISNDDGATWLPVLITDQSEERWYTYRFRPREIVPQLGDRVRVRFRLRDEHGDLLLLAALDNFEVAPTRGQSRVARAEENVRVGVAPNPASGSAAITIGPLDGSRVRVELFDALGVRAALLHDGSGVGTLRLRTPEDLTAGWYVLRVKVDEREVRSVPVQLIR